MYFYYLSHRCALIPMPPASTIFWSWTCIDDIVLENMMLKMIIGDEMLQNVKLEK